MVSSLLALYDLHPTDLLARIEQALDSVRPYLESHGGAVEVLDARPGVVRLRMTGSCQGCPSSAATLKGSIEKAIYSRVPEIECVEVAADETQSHVESATESCPTASSIAGQRPPEFCLSRRLSKPPRGTSCMSTETTIPDNPLAALRRLVPQRPRLRIHASCEPELPPEHEHVIDVRNRRLLWAGVPGVRRAAERRPGQLSPR